MNQSKIQKSIANILQAIDENPKREGLVETPARVAKSYTKLFSGYEEDPRKLLKTFASNGYDEMVIVKDIEFYSTCEHHLLPFFGKIHIGYIPNRKIIGLSKLPRLVEIFARRLQVQERLAQEIGQALFDTLKPKGVGVVIEAKHLCMMARGVEKQNSSITTSALFGSFKKLPATRTEFLQLIKNS